MKMNMTPRAKKLLAGLTAAALTLSMLPATALAAKDYATGGETALRFSNTVCPAARIIKKELRKQGIRKLKVLYSREQPAKEKLFRRRRTMVKKPAEGNISFVTGTAGYLLAGEVVRDILSAGNASHS